MAARLGGASNSRAKTEPKNNKANLSKRQLESLNKKNHYTKVIKPIMTYQEPLIRKRDLENLWRIFREPDFKVLNKPKYHGFIWLKCSGALGMMKSNKGYYETLKTSFNEFNYPNPQFNQIEIDLKRTFPNQKNPEQMEKDIIPLRNVLTSYVIRNPQVGYCQGMNFIAARLIACQKEEEAFWTLCQLIECILPMDYYSNLLGVLID